MSVNDELLNVGSVIAGVILGSFLTFFIERSMQNRSWKRNLIEKRIDSTYIPLYRDIVSIPATLSIYPTVPGLPSFKWNEIKNSESRLYLNESLIKSLQEFFDVDIKEYQKKCDIAYKSVYKTIRDYFGSLISETDTSKLDGVAGTLISYFSPLLFDSWESFRKTFTDEESFGSYISNIQSMAFGQLLAISGDITTIPDNFLHQIKFRIDNLEEIKVAKTSRNELIKKSESIRVQLEQYIKQSWTGKLT